MEIIFYVLTVIVTGFNALGALGKKYSNAYTQREKFLNIACFSALVAMVTWIVFAFSGEKITGTALLFAALFGVNFVLCNYVLYAAMEVGSLSKTNLFTSFSLIIPTLAGVIFWHEEFNIWLLSVALLLMLASLLLILLRKDADEGGTENGKKAKAKWIVFSILAFITNGLSTIIQKAEQTAANGEGAFSMTALSFTFTAVIAFAVFLLFSAIRKWDMFRQDMAALSRNKKSVFLNATGVGVVNLAATYLSTRVAAAFLYPCVLGGSVIITAVFSAVFFKEKMGARTVAGILLGVVSIVLLSL